MYFNEEGKWTTTTKKKKELSTLLNWSIVRKHNRFINLYITKWILYIYLCQLMRKYLCWKQRANNKSKMLFFILYWWICINCCLRIAWNLHKISKPIVETIKNKNEWISVFNKVHLFSHWFCSLFFVVDVAAAELNVFFYEMETTNQSKLKLFSVSCFFLSFAFPWNISKLDFLFEYK